MSPRGGLRRDVAWTAAGNVAYGAAQWGILVALARLGGAEVLGVFALALAVTAPLMVAGRLELRTVLATDAGRAHPLGHYLRLRWVSGAVALAGSVVAALALGYRDGLLLVVVLVGIGKVGEAMSDVAFGRLALEGRHDLVGRSHLVKAVASFGAVTGVYAATGNLAWSCAALAAAWWILYLVQDLPAARRMAAEDRRAPATPEGRGWGELLALALVCLPLGAATLWVSLRTSLPRIVVEDQVGTAAVGILAAIAALGVVGGRLVLSVNQALAPRLVIGSQSGESSGPRQAAAAMMGVALAVGGAGILAAAVAGEPILRTLYSDEVSAYAHVFLLLAVAFTLEYLATAVRVVLTARRRIRGQGSVTALSLAVVAALALLLVPGAGLIGVAWALIAGAAVELAGVLLLLSAGSRARAPEAKRIFDVAVALPLLLLLSPVLLVIALAVRLTMGAPVLFRQERPGLDGRIFTLVKFRTMRHATDARGRPLPDERRITRLGRFLRETSLDELPGLWNVLLGHMSLVGPRPLLPEYLPRYTPRQARRHEVRPGITGWAQVNGRNAPGWEERLAMDVWYVDNRSFLVDLRILLLTPLRVLSRRGVSQAGHATVEPFQGSAHG